MMVIFDGTDQCPMGRQLYAEEWPRQAPPAQVHKARFLVRSTPRQVTQETRSSIIRRALRERPHTAAELAPLVGESIAKTHQLLYQMSSKHLIRGVGYRPVERRSVPGSHRMERLYGLVGES